MSTGRMWRPRTHRLPATLGIWLLSTPDGDAQGGDVVPDGTWRRNGRLVAFPRELQAAGHTAAKRPGEVNEVMPDRGTAPGWSKDVLSGDRAEAALVQPRRKHEQAPQIATMLVKDRVVGVVASSSEQLIWTKQRLTTLRQARRDRAIGPIRPRGTRRRNPSMSAAIRARVAPALDTACLRRWLRAGNARTGRGSSRAHRPQRVEKARRHHLGAGRQPLVSIGSKRSR